MKCVQLSVIREKTHTVAVNAKSNHLHEQDS